MAFAKETRDAETIPAMPTSRAGVTALGCG